MKYFYTCLVIAACARSVPDAPRAIAWDKEVCAHCHMLVGEPRAAAELVTDDGDVFVFDDPACAVRFVAEKHPQVHRLWFHGDGDTWIAADDAAFVTTRETPMGSGRVAVPKDTPGAEPYDAFTREVTRAP